MSRTFTSADTYTNYGLVNGGYNPITIQSGASFNGAVGPALYASGTYAWTITNAGTITGYSNGDGIKIASIGALAPGGTVTNQSGGTIIGDHYGIQIYSDLGDADSVVNYDGGTISGTNTTAGGAVYLYSAGSVVNYGVIAAPALGTGGFGVRMQNGGKIVNADTITDVPTIRGYIGAYFYSPAGAASGTLVNSGFLIGEGGDAVRFGNNGNNVTAAAITNAPGGYISGYDYGIRIFNSGFSHVTNQSGATIAGTNPTRGGGVYLFSAGSVSNAGLIKARTVTGGAYGLLLKNGGTVSNVLGGTIKGSGGVYSGTAASTVVNAGVINGAGGNAIQFGKAGTYIASALIANQSGGQITGGVFGIDVQNSGLASIANYGTISTTDTVGGGAVYLRGTGSITNYGVIKMPALATAGAAVRMNDGALLNGIQVGHFGTIEGFIGAYIYSTIGGTSGTVVNYNSIIGTGGDGIAIGNAANFVTSAAVTNESGGSISGGAFGIAIFATSANDIINYYLSSITGTNTTAGGAIYLYNPGTVTNNGAITAPTTHAGITGIHFANGGKVLNTDTFNGTAVIQGYTGIYLGAASLATISTVVNSGLITAGTGDGIELGSQILDSASGTITNQPGGSIFGGGYGVQMFNTGDSAVTNQSAATISSSNTTAGAGVFLLNPGTVVNAGQITAPSSNSGVYGVRLANGGGVTNSSGGTIQGHVGVYIGQSGVSGHATSVVNTGKIVGTGNGVQLGRSGVSIQSGSVTNITGGSIAGGNYGIGIFNSGASYVINQAGATISGTNTAAGDAVLLTNPGTVTNHGVIHAAAGRVGESGVYLPGGGSVINYGNGTIQGNRGVYVGHSGGLGTPSTVANYGTIIAATGDYAVYFGSGAPTSRLIVGTTAQFNGSIQGGGGVMELAPAASPASIYGFGDSITNFGSVLFDSANWTVGGSSATLGTIEFGGFVTGDTIDVADFQAVSYTFGGNELTLTAADTSQLMLNVDASDGTVFQLGVYGPGGTAVTECFAVGTRIATPEGEVAVEDLAAGDVVLAEFAGATPIQWIGHRHVDCARHPDPETVWPVRVAAGALGEGLPRRDLMLSPNHAVFVRGALIPVRHLINGWSITQAPVASVVYYHIELLEHDLLLAEGQPAESYLDVGDRSNFINGGAEVRLHPDFGKRGQDAAAAWEMYGCAPLVVRGPGLEAARCWVNEISAGGVERRAA